MSSKETLSYSFESAWNNMDDGETAQTIQFSETYKDFLDNKTERACAAEIVKQAQENGFVSLESQIEKGEKLQAGQKVYALNRDKSVILFVIGSEPIEKGMHIVGSHIDAPRLDLKPFPLYEDSDMAFLKTHYYGGIKKYQWTTIPLAMHGVIFTSKGEKISINIGEDPSDPIFTITDLLPHLGKDLNQKKLGEAITGEALNILVGSIPLEYCDKEAVKMNVLKLLHEKYGINESDFTSAEIEVVPAGKARDLGLDCSMVHGYGQDDRVCTYAGLKAILEIETPTKTAVGMFMDKEEVGSQGNTGSESAYFEHCLAELIELQDKASILSIRRALANTQVLSADVGAAFDPTYPQAYEKQNSAHLGHGVLISKYTGARGKSGCNDANAEFLSEVMRTFTEADVTWQIGELGKVDQGGGGTIAYILANAGADVVDCGTPLLSMHAPYEIASKADIYMTYKAYKAFLAR